MQAAAMLAADLASSGGRKEGSMCHDNIVSALGKVCLLPRAMHHVVLNAIVMHYASLLFSNDPQAMHSGLFVADRTALQKTGDGNDILGSKTHYPIITRHEGLLHVWGVHSGVL